MEPEAAINPFTVDKEDAPSSTVSRLIVDPIEDSRQEVVEEPIHEVVEETRQDDSSGLCALPNEQRPEGCETRDIAELGDDVWNSFLACIDPTPRQDPPAAGVETAPSLEEPVQERSVLPLEEEKVVEPIKTSTETKSLVVEPTVDSPVAPSSPNSPTAIMVENTLKFLRIPTIASENEQVALVKDVKVEISSDSVCGESLLDAAAPSPEDSVQEQRQFLIQQLKDTIAQHGRYDIKCAHLVGTLGDMQSDPTKAVKLHQDAVTIYTSKLGEMNEQTINAQMRLGDTHVKAGDYDAAIAHYQQGIASRRILNGENSASVADGLVQVAHALSLEEEYMLAIKELKRALKIYRDTLGDADEKVTLAVDEIASLYMTCENYNKASAILEEVVKLKAANRGADHRSVADTLVLLVSAYEKSSQPDTALKSMKKAYKIYNELGSETIAEATDVLSRMAASYESTSDHHRAAVAHLGVLRGQKAMQSPENLVVGDAYYKLGCSLRQTGQHDKALKCMKEALPLYISLTTEVDDASRIAEILREMALINKEKDNHEDAVSLFKQELDVRRKLRQPNYPVIAKTLSHLGVSEYALGNNTSALKYLVEALTILQDQGPDSVDCAEVLFHTGLVFEKVDNGHRALEALTEAARIFKDHGYDSTHPHLNQALLKIQELRNAKKELFDV